MAFLPDSQCVSVTELTPEIKQQMWTPAGKHVKQKPSLKPRECSSSVNLQLFNQHTHLTLHAEGFAEYQQQVGITKRLINKEKSQ